MNKTVHEIIKGKIKDIIPEFLLKYEIEEGGWVKQFFKALTALKIEYGANALTTSLLALSTSSDIMLKWNKIEFIKLLGKDTPLSQMKDEPFEMLLKTM